MPYKDEEKQREYQREWYRKKFSDKEARDKKKASRDAWRKKNAEHIAAYDRERRKTEVGRSQIRSQGRRSRITRTAKKIKLVQELKVSKGCSNCPENHLATLDFHHLDPETKKYTICRLAHKSGSFNQLLEELAKCVILCANCHRKLHWESRQE